MSQTFNIIRRFSSEINSLFRQKTLNSNFRRYIKKQTQTPKPEPQPQPNILFPIPKRYFLKTTLAFVGFTGVCFAGGSILYYENALSGVNSPSNKKYKIRSQLNEFWNNLTTFQKYLYVIIGLNVLVFIGWQIPRLSNIFHKYFLNFPKKEAMYSSILFSTFSHISIAHIAFNMIALYSFGSALESVLGAEQFLAVYLTGGFFATYVSNNIKILTSAIRPSLGASGALLACFAIICLAYPDSRFAIIFLPFISFRAEDLLKVVIGLDVLGLFFRRSGFDHIAHLCGTLFGIWYYKYGHKYLWESQKNVIQIWHDVKSKKD